MKHKKSSKTQIKILTDEFTSILKPHSKYPQYQPAKTKQHHLSKHTKTNSTKINLVSTDVFKNLPKHSSSKSTEHNLLDQTKNSSDTATTVSKRYTNTNNNSNSNNKLNILKTNAHRDYMENFLKTVNKSINKNKSFILTKTSNTNNITLMSGNAFANKKKFNVTNTNNGGNCSCSSSSNKKKKKKNVVSTCSGKTCSNGVVEGNSNKYSNEVYTSSNSNKNGCSVQYKYNISNNVMDYHSSSLISEESVFSSNKHSITNTHNSSSLKYLIQGSNKYSSNNNSISNEQDYVSYTYSDDEVSCRSKSIIMYLYIYIESSRNKLVLKEGNNTSIYGNNSNNYKCSNNSNNIFHDLHFQQNQLISSINQDDFRSFYNELNRKLFGNTNTNTTYSNNII